MNARQTVSLHLKRRDNCEKVKHVLRQDILKYLVPIWKQLLTKEIHLLSEETKCIFLQRKEKKCNLFII